MKNKRKQDNINEKDQREEDQRPWGGYRVIYEKDNYKVKEIYVLPKQRLSYQRHSKRTEHWCIVKGSAVVTLDDKDIKLAANQTITIPVASWHRIENATDDKLIFIEVQIGSYLGEDDIERKEDDYGRA